MAIYWALGPGVLFGALGAAALTFLVRPGQQLRALAVGVLVGFACPVAFFGALMFILPQNEGTMGWYLFGFIFAMTGMFAGIMAGNSIGSEPAQ